MSNAAIAAYRAAKSKTLPFTKLNWGVANVIGIESALLLEIIQDWCDNNMDHQRKQYFHDDHWWTRGTYQEWEKRYPSLGSCRTLQRLLLNLESNNYVLSDQFNKGKDNTKFYRVNEEKIGELYLQAIEEFRKSTMPNWHDDTEVSNPPCQIGTTTMPNWHGHDAKLAQSSIYKQINKTDQNNSSPLTPQGEEREKTFGFEIPENSSPNLVATLEAKSETLQLTTNPSVKTIIPAAPQDPFFGKHRKSSDVVWDWLPEGPWKVNGKLCPSFLEAIAHRWTKDYGGDTHTNKLKVQKHFRNELTNLPIEWEWYQSTYLHKAANVQTRKQAGIDTSKDEKEVIKHIAAFNQLPDEMRVTETLTANEFIESNVSYALPSVVATQTQLVAQVESVKPTEQAFGVLRFENGKLETVSKSEHLEAVNDDVWEAIAQQTSEWEEQQKAQAIPEGADNPAAYQNVVKSDDRDFWANLHQNRANDVTPVQTTAPMSIAKLAVAKSMPKWDREKEKEQKRARTRLEHWNNLLASGLPSVMADAERQARAAGYIIVGNQVVEPEF